MGETQRGTLKAAMEAEAQKQKQDKAKLALVEKPPLSFLASQFENGWIAKEDILDSQTNQIGNPKKKTLDIKIAKDDFRIAKDEADLDSNIAKEKSLDSQKKPKKGKWKNYDKARSTTSVFIRAASEIVNEIKHFNIENKFDMKEFFELAARSFLDSFGNPKNQDLDSNIAFDDLRLKMFYKTDARIINLFREYQRFFHRAPEWKPKDDAVGVKYNEIDLRVIEIGIIQTQSNIIENESETKPERFKYYTREIDRFNLLGYSETMLDGILMTYRKRWKQLTASVNHPKKADA